LIAMLEDAKNQETIRVSSAVALGKLGDTRAVPALTSALNDPAYAVRTAAAASLQKITGRPIEIESAEQRE
jgi:HEAT repeat protein